MLLSKNQIKYLYNMSFHTKEGHSLRFACLRAMGKTKIAYDQLFENELEAMEAIEQAPNDVQAAIKEESVLLAMKATIEDTRSQLPAGAWAKIKAYFTDHNINLREIVHAKATPDTFSGRFFGYVDNYITGLSGKNLFAYLYQVISAKTPEDLAAAHHMAVEDFYKTLGVTPATFTKYLLTFGGVLAFMDTHTAHIVEKWITVAKVAIPGLLNGIGLGAIMFKIGLWLAGAWIAGLIFGPEVVASVVRKVVGSFVHIPIVLLTTLLKGIKASFNLVVKIASSVFSSVKNFFSGLFMKKANKMVMKQARLLALRDPSFKRAYLSLPQVI